MEDIDFGNAHKKSSSEFLFADYGRNFTDGEDPTAENKRVIDLFDPVDSMSLNREKDKVVVSGIRGVLQVIKIQNSKNDVIEGPFIVKDLDMRVYRKGKVNILYSAQNVKWNQLYDQYIATTSSNGSIVCWNISRRNKSVFKAHERSATCLDWHATTPYILVSGSRDCTVKSYDMRVKDNHQLTFSDRTCESIRDVAMCKVEDNEDYFFTGDDGGVIRLWDLRQTKKWILQKVAHRSFVSTLSLNPHYPRLLATGGGRDKMVKIWEYNGAELNRISVVETTAPLGRVVWNPYKPSHLATCASVNETSVHVWDVRRPYLPYVTYDEHRDSVTDACWPSNDFDIFLTCGKDGLVVLHNIDSGHAPISFACDVAFDMTPDGTIGLAVNSEIQAKNVAEIDTKTPSSNRKRMIRQIPYESFRNPIKSLLSFGVPEALTHSLPPTMFYKIAEKYLIGGQEIIQLCESNSKIARKNGLEHVAQTWRLVEALCEQANIQEEYDTKSAEEKERIIRAWVIRKKELAEEGRRWLANLNDHYKDDVKKQVVQRLENTQYVTAFLKFSSSSESDEMSDDDKVGEDTRNAERVALYGYGNTCRRRKRNKMAVTATDFYFGAGEANFKGGRQEVLHHNEFMGLHDEAYDLRDEEKERKFFCKAKKQPSNSEEYEDLHKDMRQTEADFQAWSPMLEIYRLLLYHAEQGDMQTCATVSMVCGRKLLDAVDPYTVNGWIQCYMEMLDKLELFLVCAKIRKYCPLESISAVSRENTTIQLAHADCDALIVNGRCTKCEALAQADCTVCRFAIVGMTFQCNICGHCMHTDHAYEWFQKTNECAFVGCPCTCGQNTWPDMDRTFIGNDDVKKGHRKFNHHEQTEPIINRVDASRLDTDSEESPEEDLEWSTAPALIREKYGEMARENGASPWARHLISLYQRRVQKPDKIPMEVVKVKKEKRESEDESLNAQNLVAKKELNRNLVRKTLMSHLEDTVKICQGVIENSSDEEIKEDVDRKEFVHRYLASYEEKNGKYKQSDDGDRLNRTLELIEEEDVDMEEPKKDNRGVGNMEESIGIDGAEKSNEDEEELEEYEFPNNRSDIEIITDENAAWNDLFGNDYIRSIGPIGIENCKEASIEAIGDDNNRVTSPTFLSATVKEHLRKLKGVQNASNSGCSTSSDNDENEKINGPTIQEVIVHSNELITTEREGKQKKAKKELSYGEKALQILNMTREQLKRKKAMKENRLIKEIVKQIRTSKKPVYTIEVSSDEYYVSSMSDDLSSSCSSASEIFVPETLPTTARDGEGYKAESELEQSSSESSSHEELSAKPENRLSAPHSTGDIYAKHESPVPIVVQKVKKFKKVSRSIDFSSDGENGKANGYAEQFSICIEGTAVSSSSSQFSTPPISPIPSLPSSRFSSSQHSRSVSSENLYDGDCLEEMLGVQKDPEILEALSLPGKSSAPPSRKSSELIPPEAPIIEPPIITSYANPIFTRITGRHTTGRSSPVTINGDGFGKEQNLKDEIVQSAPGICVVNPCFESSSLPKKKDNESLSNNTAQISLENKKHRSVESMPSTQEARLSNDNQNHPSVTDLLYQNSHSRQRFISVGSENRVFVSPSRLSLSSQTNECDYKLMQKRTGKKLRVKEKPPEPSDSDLFSSDGDLLESAQSLSDNAEEIPFFPTTSNDAIIPKTRHSWENEEQYQERLREEAQDEGKENRLNASVVANQKLEKDENEVTVNRKTGAEPAILNKHTPMMKELAKRKRRLQIKREASLKLNIFSQPMQPLKRVKFTQENLHMALTKAFENLKFEAPDISSDSDSDYDNFIREQEVCLRCKHVVKGDKKEKEYVQWLKNITDEGQMFFAKSLEDPCSVFQLSYLDTYITDVTKARRIASYLLEFIKLFYFIKWDDLLQMDNDFVLKEVYSLWHDYQKKRPKICRSHYRDYKFKFFASSIAAKMKQELSVNELPQAKQSLLSYDWLHIKTCVNTLHDDTDTLDQMLDTPVLRNPAWTIEEKKAANRYWELFGKVPLHIETSHPVVVTPLSEDRLDIIDDTNYWTKKMLRNLIYSKRKNGIKLTYTKHKKDDDMFYAQDRSKKLLNREWQLRLEKMVNETRLVDFSTSSFRVNPHEKLIYTADQHHPWPICQFDMGKHYVTVQPMASKTYTEFKSRVRRKFNFRPKSRPLENAKHIDITIDDLRKLPSFKKFEPRLQKANDFKIFMSKHFKVVDKAVVENRRHLYTIMEEDDEVELIVQMLENHPFNSGKGRLDPEDIFAERRIQREKKEKDALGKMNGMRYRKELANTEKLEIEKMKVMKKHWMPEMRRNIRVARKVIEIGRILMEEEVQKWMEYQYELSFVKKKFRRKLLFTKKDMKKNTPIIWSDAIDRIDFTEPYSIPPYVNTLPELKEYDPPCNSTAYNSSSDSEDYDEEDRKTNGDSFIQFETQPDLPVVAAKLQNEIREQLEIADELVNDDWEYSDNTSISTWFDDEVDDIVNRLINPDYLDEHIILKERAKGSLGRKLWEVMKDREKPESESDEEEYESINIIMQRDNKKKAGEEAEWMEKYSDIRDAGITDGQRTKELVHQEARRDIRKTNQKRDYKKEAEQVRWFLKQFALDHSYTTEPYVWHEDLRGAISTLHKCELRRVKNRVHKEMKDEYRDMAEQEEIVSKAITCDENSIQYKMINFLLFRKNGESYKESTKDVIECKKILRPIHQYEMFFGKEGVYMLKAIADSVMEMKNIRESFNYLIRRISGGNEISEAHLRAFMKLWWYNSRNTLERFITCCEETIEIEEQINEDIMFWYNCSANLEILRDTFDQLEIASVLNDLVYTVDQYVEETEILFRDAATEADRKAFGTMSIFEWNELKFGYPEWRNDVSSMVDDEAYLISRESSISDDQSMSEKCSSSSIFVAEADSHHLTSDNMKSQIITQSPDRILLSKSEKEEDGRRNRLKEGHPNQQMMEHYSAVYQSLKDVEEVEKRRRAEDFARKTIARWTEIENQQRWEAEDMERKVHDYLMLELAVKEKEMAEQNENEKFPNWREIIENVEDFTYSPTFAIYEKDDIPYSSVLEMCGVPFGLDNQMFHLEMLECQSAATSVSDASEIRDAIERDYEEEIIDIPTANIDDDAQSYTSAKNVFKHELYFQRELKCRRVPSCVVIFTPEKFFEEQSDPNNDFEKWKEIIEVSECPYTFNKLVIRERLLQKCRDEFRDLLIEKYFAPHEQRRKILLQVFRHCQILVVVDTELQPWSCRVVSPKEVLKPPKDRITYLRNKIVEESQETLINWLEVEKIDLEVYSNCPVIIVRSEHLKVSHTDFISNIYIENYIREKWMMLMRAEGLRALDAMIRMPPPPDHKLDAYKSIFKPIYEAWYHVWKFENAKSNTKTIFNPKLDPVKEYLHKARMIVNYAHQHYRMKRFDSLMSKDPTEFQLVDRSDVPSASLFDSLDAAVTKFCNDDSPHLSDTSKQVVKDTLIQLATGKIPYFTANYFGGYDYTENIEFTKHDDEENDDDKLPLLRSTDVSHPATLNGKYFELESCESEIKWLRNMYEESDFHRKRFMAVLMFEIAQKAMFRFAPTMADFERAQKRFEHLLTLHGKQRPLLDMMITKVRGTYFMPLETNLFLYDSKLITFGELVDSEMHPKQWRNRKERFEELRRQYPKDPRAMAEFLELQHLDNNSDSGSEVRSDTSSSLGGSTESLNSSKRGRRTRKAMNKAQRELMLLKLRSKPVNPDETFAAEKRALGPKKWKIRRHLNEILECIADLDRRQLESKLPAKKQDLLKHITNLIVKYSDTAHWSWGDLKMQTRARRIPPVRKMKPKHFSRIEKGKRMYKPPKKYDSKDSQSNGRKWF